MFVSCEAKPPVTGNFDVSFVPVVCMLVEKPVVFCRPNVRVDRQWCFTTMVLLPLHMMTSSNGNIFRVTGLLCGEFTGPGEFPAQRPVTRSFGVFFDMRLNKRLSKQPSGWWFETPSWSSWRQCNECLTYCQPDREINPAVRSTLRLQEMSCMGP